MQNKSTPFDGMEAVCCSPDAAYCMCGHEEAVMRMFSSGLVEESMTPEQRKWCVETAVWFGEGLYNPQELTELDDAELASSVLTAWSEYASSMT